MLTNALIVIDTDIVIASHPVPSRSARRPIPISVGSWYLMRPDDAPTSAAESAQGTLLVARLGETVVCRGISTSGNSDAAIVIYGIRQTWGGPFPGRGRLRVVEIPMAVQPDPSQLSGLPPLHVPQSFASVQALVRPTTRTLVVSFGIYTLDNGGETQTLWGYCSVELPVAIVPL